MIFDNKTLNIEIQSFLYKFINRCFIIYSKDKIKCKFCQNQNDNLEHRYFECKISQRMWIWALSKFDNDYVNGKTFDKYNFMLMDFNKTINISFKKILYSSILWAIHKIYFNVYFSSINFDINMIKNLIKLNIKELSLYANDNKNKFIDEINVLKLKI